jgi:cytochrome c-type protein NapB
MKKLAFSLLSAAVTLGTTGTALAADDIIATIRGKDLFEPEVAAAPKHYMGGKPGKQKVYGRAWHNAPPQVPHSLENMVMTPKKNTCLECHDRETYEMAEAPLMGESHYRDRQGNELETMYKGRYNCVQCHVPQVDAPPLVKNTFKGTKYVKTEHKAAPKKKEDDLF